MGQTKICVCGNHCCHTGAKKNKKTKIRTKNEFGLSYSLIRHNCGECNRWLGDKIVKLPAVRAQSMAWR